MNDALGKVFYRVVKASTRGDSIWNSGSFMCVCIQNTFYTGNIKIELLLNSISYILN